MSGLGRVVVVLLGVLGFVSVACAPEPDGSVVFAEHCASCHLDPLFPRAPHLDMMKGWQPDLIVTTLTTGLMAQEGGELTSVEREAVAEYISQGVEGWETLEP